MPAFLPFVRRWFESTFAEATAPQRDGWDAIASGRDTLIVAPTGSGKTLASFLWALDPLHRLALDGRLEDRVYVVYVSPLRALNNDIEKTLRAPLAGVRAAAEAQGLDLPEVRVAVRTGDTLAAQRQAMTRRPPHILITTPESLYILLTAAGFRPALSRARFVIVDEVHALLGGKRGAHLALSLERLQALVADAGEPRPQRIGCSATVRPVEEALAFLTGATARDAVIVDAGFSRDLDVAVVSPVDDFLTATSDTVWDATLQQAAALQRVGRAGHALSRVSKGRIVVTKGEELVEAAAVVRSIHERTLDRMTMLNAPLDVLAQQIVAAVAAESIDTDALWKRFVNAAPYRTLTRESFREVVRSVAEALPHEVNGVAPTIPFWKGEHPSRSFDLGLAVGRLRRDAAGHVDDPDFAEWARRECGLEPRAAAALRAWLVKAGEVLDGVPDDQGIVVESFADEMGGRHAMIHSVFGMRINGAWGMALKEKVRRAYGLVAEAAHVDDGLLLSFAPGQIPPTSPERLATLVTPDEVDDLLGHALIGSPLFGTRFRHAAVRALFIPRTYKGQRTPAYLMRLKADALLEAGGGLPDFPVVAETLRECFEDALDVPRFKRILGRLHDSEMWTRHVDTPLPSPFVYPLLLAWDWAYLDAGHAEERRSDAVSMRKAWSVSTGPLRPEIVAGVEAELQKTAPDRRARDANELAAILDDLGDLTREEIAERSAADPDALIEALRAERRITEDEFTGGRRARDPTADAMHYA